jgi:eukaryotic-like serine/threonine-protein kinase
MSAFDTHQEGLDGDSGTLHSQRVWKAAGQHDLDFESQQLRNRLRAKMFGVEAAPVSIGRFAVIEAVGSGGMGVVYAAHDNELDRRVAVKVLRASHEDDASVGRGRLLREAQALAKLSHPNVVQIYEVGTFDDHVFLAMEFLPGPSFRTWLLDGPRPWPDVLRHFVEAGRGLAAAHHQGVIHRDFKPANLLFGSDGRVRVVDFGLARATGDLRLGEVEAGPTSTSRVLAAELTQTGEIMGTPAYMSPEQAKREQVDARSDQYSFCVALYEALFGMRPHVGRSTAEVLVSVAEGRVRNPPRGTKVPARAVRAVMRGLSVEPADRFPSMELLLEQLEPRDHGRWRVLGAGSIVAVGLSVLMLVGEDSCPSFDRELDEAWSVERQAEMEAAFVESGAAGASASLALAHARLDAYAHEWLDARKDACEAHLVRREQSDGLYDRRVACLFERRAELATLTHALATADTHVVGRAPLAASELTPVAECEDLERMQRQGDVDPARQELRVRLAQARAQHKVGHYEAALATLAAVTDAAHELGAPELEAAGLFQRGSIHLRRRAHAAATDAFELAADLAEAGADDEQAARAWIYLARAQAMLDRIAWADHSIRRAKAKSRRLGDARIDHDVRESEAFVAWQAERFEDAIASQSLVVEWVLATFGERHPRMADAEHRYASMLSDAGRHQEAQARYARAIAVLEQTLGSEHPELARVWFDMGIDHRRAGRDEDARRALEQAEARFQAVVGARTPEQADVNEQLGLLALARGDLDEADRRATLALELSGLEGLPPSERLDALSLHINVAAMRGRYAEAERSCRTLLELLASGSFGPNEQIRGLYTRQMLVELLLVREQHAEAEAEAESLLADLSHRKDESLAPIREATTKFAAAARQAREGSAGQSPAAERQAPVR